MPYKNLEIKKEYLKNYNKNLSSEQKNRKLVYNKNWWSSDKGRYSAQKYHAKKRKIEFNLSFNEWVAIWTASGNYENRGTKGYQICLYKDEGPYSKDNVYIATQAQNKKDAWLNNKIATPTGQYYKDTQCDI